MSYLLEILGRGRLTDMARLFGPFLTPAGDEDIERLSAESIDRPDDALLHAQLATACLGRHQSDRAAASFKRALRLDGNLLEARLGLACCYEQTDRLGEAIEQLNLANTAAVGDPSVLLALGYCHERAGHANQAAEFYRDLLTSSPGSGQARERLAAIDLAAGRIEAAVDQYEQLRADTGGGDARIRLCLGNLYLKASRSADATEEFGAAIALAPENWSARDQLVESLVQQNRLGEAAQHLEQSLQEHNDRAETHLQLADVYTRTAEDALAVHHYSAAMTLNEDYLEAAVKLATQHLRFGRFADAAASFNRAVQISDRALTAYVGLAVAQKNSGQWEQAADTLELAAQIAPNSTLLFREMARLEMKVALARQGQNLFTPQSARDAGPTDSPDTLEDWNELLDFQVDRHQQAVIDRPNHADLHYRLGLLLLGQDDLPGAIEQFAGAVAINPTYTKARVKLGLTLHKAGQTDRAIEELSAALDINPHFADVHYRLGLMFVEQQRFADAADRFEQSLAINAANPDVRANLATCLETMGLLDRASEQWTLLAGGPEELPQTATARQRLANIPKAE